MASFKITGGNQLSGTIIPQGAKNEALQILCAVILTEEEVIESLANFDSLEDKAFEAVVALMKKKDEKKKEAEAALPPALKEAIEKKKNKEGKDKEADAKPKAGEAEAEVTPELLEEVQTTEATLVVPEKEEVNTTRASIENWLENNVLTKVK